MKTSTLLWAVAAIIVLGGVAWAGVTYPKAMVSLGSPTGSTFGDAKVALINWAPATNAATTTYLLNTDGSDRIIKNVEYWCTGLGSVNGAPIVSTGWVFNAATTTSAVAGTNGNTNYVLSTSVATTTSELWISSTTPGLAGTADYRRWPSNTYLSFAANASSTNAACTIGVTYNAT